MGSTLVSFAFTLHSAVHVPHLLVWSAHCAIAVGYGFCAAIACLEEACMMGATHTWLHSLASPCLCVGFASPCSVCGLHSVFRVWASLLFASPCSVCSSMASLCAPCVGFASSKVSAVSDYSVRLSCMRPLLSPPNGSAASDCSVRLSCMRPLLSLAMRLAIPHCVTLAMHGTWHGTPRYACMCQGTHTSFSLCGTATSSLACDETGHSILRDTHHAWHMAWHTSLCMHVSRH